MFFFKLLSYLPLRVLYILSDLVYPIVWKWIGYRKEVIHQNIENAFPEKSESERSQIIAMFQRNLLDFIVETIKLMTISKEELNSRLSVSNPEVILDYFNNNQSMLLTASHQFNWEWMVTFGRTTLGYPFTSVYRPLRDNFFDRLAIVIRTRFGGKLITSDELIEDLKNNPESTAYSMVMDHVTSKHHYWTTFLSQETLFDTSIDYLAKTLDMPVVYPKLQKVKRGFYSVELIPIGEPPYEQGLTLLPRFIEEIEKSIREQPETWLWSHRRWKYKRI
ncbi:MAG: lysophospholipid acyltransferase family protein [Bacteroidetes bacterium]|nr:lysophospholipid acyltransferase family protein [Bacteroidota bacterium]MDA1119158.1 lysophospholipid acyltransferase family protein [Bacteroidota bacterium]